MLRGSEICAVFSSATFEAEIGGRKEMLVSQKTKGVKEMFAPPGPEELLGA